jgi:hypothetical protein
MRLYYITQSQSKNETVLIFFQIVSQIGYVCIELNREILVIILTSRCMLDGPKWKIEYLIYVFIFIL